MIGDDVEGSFNVLIMDIEGAELAFARENRSFFKQLDLCIVEVHNGILDEGEIGEFKQVLIEAGLRMVDHSYMTEVWSRCL